MKGFFGFVIVFVLLIILLGLSLTENRFYSSIENSKILLIESEQASKERTILESGLDKVVRYALLEQLLQKNFEIEIIKTEINQKILDYVSEKGIASDIFLNILGKPTLNFLNENSEAIVVEKAGITYTEYTFTGGILRDKTVSKKLGENIELVFMIPPGYTVRIIE